MLIPGRIEMTEAEEEKVSALIAKAEGKNISIARALPDEKGHLLVEIDGKVTEVKE